MRSEVRSFEIDEITKLLDAGGNFRKFDEVHARRWLAEMKAGRWVQPHPSPIVLNRKTVLDGQHRLWAAREYARETGRKVKFLVIIVEQDTDAIALSIDTNKKRTTADYLRREGVENASAVAACLATAAAARKSDKLRATVFDNTHNGTPSEMIEVFESDRARIVECTKMAVACSKAGIGCTGLLAGVAYLISKKNRNGCRLFFERLASQTGLEEGDPILRLLRYFQDKKGEGTRRSVTRRAVHASLVIKAWNAWANGERPKLLKWAPNGDKPEEFPQIEKGDASLFGAA
jgi:hypothetical protein